MEAAYLKLLGWVMNHRWVVVVAAMATLGSCFPLMKAVPKGFLPKSDEAQFEITVRVPEGTSLASTNVAVERMARAVRAWPEVTATVLTIGDSAEKTPNLAKILGRRVQLGHRPIHHDRSGSGDLVGLRAGSHQEIEGHPRRGGRGYVAGHGQSGNRGHG